MVAVEVIMTTSKKRVTPRRQCMPPCTRSIIKDIMVRKVEFDDDLTIYVRDSA